MPEAPVERIWLQSARLAHLLNGYDTAHALGFGDLHAWANERAEEAACRGSWRGTAIELWLRLFYEHRHWGHFGSEPESEEPALLNRLCRQLRRQLGTANERERMIVLRRISENAVAIGSRPA